MMSLRIILLIYYIRSHLYVCKCTHFLLPGCVCDNDISASTVTHLCASFSASIICLEA